MQDKNDLSNLRYPIGKFRYNADAAVKSRKESIRELETLPEKLRAAVSGFNEEQFNTPYREEGWTVKQVINHIADSHLNAYIRLKLALTEDNPVIKPYNQTDWGWLADSQLTPAAVSLILIESLHTRWCILLNSLDEKEFNRTYVHPESGQLNIEYLVSLYAWHSKHHTAHITSLRKRMGW